MADIKISQLDSGTTLGGTEYVPIVQNGVTVKTTAQAIANLGGGSTPTLITKSITQNGTYNASSDNADGYSSVTVNVSGSGGAVTFTPLFVWDESGIGASNWQSSIPDGSSAQGGRQNIGREGTYEAVEGEYCVCTSSNNLRFWFGYNGSYALFGLKCQIDSDFTPVQTDNWYQASGLIGQELDGTQRDFAAIIDKNGYFALGTSTSNITSSNVSALDGEVHEIFLLAMGNKIMLFVDGVNVVSVTITMYQSQFWRVGFMWTNAVYNSRVRGKCYSMGIWTASYPTDNLTLPTL